MTTYASGDTMVIYLVRSVTGDYEDAIRDNIGAFRDRKVAEAEVETRRYDAAVLAGKLEAYLRLCEDWVSKNVSAADDEDYYSAEATARREAFSDARRAEEHRLGKLIFGPQFGEDEGEHEYNIRDRASARFYIEEVTLTM